MQAFVQPDYIDIHTHKEEPFKGLSIINLIPGKFMDMNPGQNYSIGLHPWYIDDNFQELMGCVEKIASNNLIIAIGETGLDKIHGPNINLQLELFELHIRLAERLQKPLVVHCVKAFNEIVQMKKKTTSSVPWIIHGFQANKQIAKQLIDHGMYLSFGRALMKAGSKIQQTFSLIPEDRFFLETDDSDIAIEDVYKAAAELRNVSIIELQQRIKLNFKNCFRIDFK